MSHYRRGINVLDLPITFRDAISLTRNLGFSYLWIDSLCILQDSLEDVTEEFAHLANYYANCAVIIAEGGESTSLQRFGHRMDEVVDVAQYSMYEMPRIFIEPRTLSVRGWALQESLLIRKAIIRMTIHFSSDGQNGNNVKARDKSVKGRYRNAERRKPKSNVVEDATSSAIAQPQLDGQVSTITEAQRLLDNGRELILQGSYVEATATLMLSRDRLGSLRSKRQEMLDLHAMATSMLGTTYHILGLTGIALGILKAGSELYSCLSSGKRVRDHV